jgi:hypothetical protein
LPKNLLNMLTGLVALCVLRSCVNVITESFLRKKSRAVSQTWLWSKKGSQEKEWAQYKVQDYCWQVQDCAEEDYCDKEKDYWQESCQAASRMKRGQEYKIDVYNML